MGTSVFGIGDELMSIDLLASPYGDKKTPFLDTT